MSDEDKRVVAETKSRIQKEFKEKTGLNIDQPKPGFGNTNDGNTARRFFKNAQLSAEITKIDLELIKKFHTILIVVSCSQEINIERFRNFANNTARYFVEKYPWYYMPTTLHKFLIHGPDVIASALLPIGQLSEEAQEARNKDFKCYREHFSRKCSREKSNEDILNRFLLSSDPIISHMSKKYEKKTTIFPQSALDLLILPCNSDNEVDGDVDNDGNNDDDDDDYNDSDDNDDNDNESDD